ncbi:hypothetical protein [Haloglomus salinum]|uniref:hypothetical protein n=1 Tax=Haloglomus salinum TaxID=2962673 RepID=UPI0020C9CC6E|nr:hypothetical protein [Haloglomus salinum]
MPDLYTKARYDKVLDIAEASTHDAQKLLDVLKIVRGLRLLVVGYVVVAVAQFVLGLGWTVPTVVNCIVLAATERLLTGAVY